MRDDALLPVRERGARAAAGGDTRVFRLVFAALLVAALAAAGDACADICKYIDADGNTHYSNLPPDKGWRRLGCTASDDPKLKRSGDGAGSRNAPSPQGFPRVDPDTQKSRDDIRRKVLGDELAAEEKLLVESRSAYADGAPVPLPEERADAEKYRTRLARLRQSMTVHEKNIEALRKELAAIK
jgi:hypothetical protein